MNYDKLIYGLVAGLDVFIAILTKRYELLGIALMLALASIDSMIQERK